MESGYLHLKNFLKDPQLSAIEDILRKFHQSWLHKYEAAYQKGAINSAYITSGEFLSAEERLHLLKFVGSKILVAEAKNFLGNDIRFLNTQIFFNPFKKEQKNYWHRDIQYTGQTIEQQVSTITAQESQVVHLRLALADENGIEVVPGSHFRWDTQSELEVRLQQNGKTSADEIRGSEAIPLKKGDLLVFDANLIHRGLYGQDRFAFDILFCKPFEGYAKFIDPRILPKHEELRSLESQDVF